MPKVAGVIGRPMTVRRLTSLLEVHEDKAEIRLLLQDSAARQWHIAGVVSSRPADQRHGRLKPTTLWIVAGSALSAAELPFVPPQSKAAGSGGVR